MRRIVFIILLVTVPFSFGCARRIQIRKPVKSKTLSLKDKACGIKAGVPQAPMPAIPGTPLTVGERFEFIAAWKGIPVGRASATVEELTILNGHEVYKVVVRANTNKILSKLFRVEDIFTSYIDKQKFITRRYESVIREGRYKKDLVVDYDFKNRVAIFKNLKDGSVKKCPIEKDARDPICASYYFRTLPLKVGDEINVNVNLNEKNYEIIGVIEDRANVRIPKIGTYDAFLLRPYAMLGGKRQKRGKTWGYISSDKKRIPLYLAVKVLEIPWIGAVTATLTGIEYVAPSEN